MCECIKHSRPDSQREGLAGCGRGGSAACHLTDPCGSHYSCWRRVISGMRCENRAWGTWARLLCGRAIAMRWKPISTQCRLSTQQAMLRAEQDPTVCEWGSSWDQLLQEHMCLAKIHSFYKMRSPLCQNCPEWCWNICGVPQGFVIGILRLRTSIAFTLYTSFSLGVCLLFSFSFFVSNNTLLGGAYRWYPKASFVCSVH